ncbi:MAG TPA: tetratricopeptide repeat protein [Candidatus Acidoferrales bacterium]|nr:tetratricopeptide repeat protein [Candidatus Acidoferrales bacterium]HEV2490366.1 tetratricopeptide repeat protein [Candidatus Acidoferrales bacterium]
MKEAQDSQSIARKDGPMAMSHVEVMVGTPSSVDAGMVEFKECLKRMRDGHPEDALSHARRALGAAPKNPFYLSYTGLLAAMADRRFGDAETLCREALNLKCNHAQLYLNLAEVYNQAGRTPDAIETLEKGMVSAGRDFRIRRALERIGVRRAPLLTFLHRNHPVNRMLGRLRHRFAGPARPY